MAETTNLTFYKVYFTPAKNAKVDKLSDYLSGLTQQLSIENFQYIKVEPDIKIKLALDQKNTPNFPYNYVKIQRTDDTKNYYYFVLNSSWTAAGTISLELSIDSINTFDEDLEWLPTTKITRQHKDRFEERSKVVADDVIQTARIVDDFSEGLSPTKTLATKEKIKIDNFDYDHYLIYKTNNTETTKPIDCYYCASGEIAVDSGGTDGIIYSDFDKAVNVIFFSRDNDDFVFTATDGTKTTIGKNQKYKALLLFKNKTQPTYFGVRGITENGGLSNTFLEARTTKCLTDLSIIGYVFDYEDLETKTYGQLLTYYNTHTSEQLILGGTSASYIKTIDEIDKTDTTLVKIIKMPYAPFEPSFITKDGVRYLQIPNGWIFNNNLLKLADLNNQFLTTVTPQPINEMIAYITKTNIGKEEANQKYESKLYNSEFYTLKFAYDNFEKEFLMERYKSYKDATSFHEFRPVIDIKFVQSNNISSNSLFDFTMEYVEEYKELSTYSEFLNVNRSQEVALYSSDYLTYMRTGYNYDRKAQALSLASNITSTALSAGASVLGYFTGGEFAKAAGISMASSAATSLVGIITSQISAENAIQQKIEQAQKSAASVSSTVDLSLLSYYNGNRLLKITEEPTKQIKEMIYDLFRLTGYACSDYAIPDVNSRIYYNYIQCEAEFDESKWNYGKEFLDDVKARYNAGVTVFHNYNGSYDFLQEKENFEIWLLNCS